MIGWSCRFVLVVCWNWGCCYWKFFFMLGNGILCCMVLLVGMFCRCLVFC